MILLFSLFPFFAMCELKDLLPQLIEKAIEGQANSYAPYSHYFVGAALLTQSGKIYSGCNIENASYGLSNCAERTAVFKAVSEGEREFDVIVIVTRDGGMPCGACRQVLNEFNPNMKVITVDGSHKICQETAVSEF